MTTFDSTKLSLPKLTRDIKSGKIQLPDFQRGWVRDNDHVQCLWISIAKPFLVVVVMLMGTGREVRGTRRKVACR